MKKLALAILSLSMATFNVGAQESKNLESAVRKLDEAKTVKDYKAMSENFLKIAEVEKTNWLSWYYAAFCNAKIGWLYQEDGDKIEPYANLADEQIAKSLSLIDMAKQTNELSEVYCVLGMLNQAKVFINPATFGSEFGPKAFNYFSLAQQTNPKNPRALYLGAWQKFFTPKAYGGDKAKARELLAEAKGIQDANPGFRVNPHWGKTEVEDLLKQAK